MTIEGLFIVEELNFWMTKKNLSIEFSPYLLTYPFSAKFKNYAKEFIILAIRNGIFIKIPQEKEFKQQKKFVFVNHFPV